MLRTGLLLLAAQVQVMPAMAAELRLCIGDVLDVGVAGLPDLRSRLAIDPDGNIGVPLLGTLHVAGRTLADVRTEIQRGLPERIFQRRSGDGPHPAPLVQPQDIVVSVAEYRPIYVGGDVARPGEYAYRPGMTARQAILLAGDYDMFSAGIRINPIEKLRFRREINEALTDLGRLEMKAKRLRAQLNDGALEPPDPAAPPAVIEYNRMEAARLQRDRTLFRAALQQNETALQRVREQLGSMQALRGQQEDAMRRQTAELENLRGLFQRGMTSQNRLGEEQRALLFLSERMLQTTARIQELETRLGELAYQRNREEEEWRQKALAELQEVEGQMARLRVATSGRSGAPDAASLSAGSEDEPPEPLIRIDRARGEAQQLAAEETTVVIPGDVVTVRLARRREPAGRSQRAAMATEESRR